MELYGSVLHLYDGVKITTYEKDLTFFLLLCLSSAPFLEVNFFPHMTVRETLNFRVELKLGSMLKKKSRDKMVDDLIQQMRLEKTADTIVGDSKVRGISGGERRRLSIACELISSPSVIFLDEPTSGACTIYIF
jgi:ABC-type lipopolysaccharide export system ATPase subunit